MNKEIDNILTVLMEECAEVIKVASKIKRFGFKDSHPKTGNIKNYILLIEEFGDLIGAWNYLKNKKPKLFNSNSSLEILQSHIDSKRDKINKYYKYSKKALNVS